MSRSKRFNRIIIALAIVGFVVIVLAVMARLTEVAGMYYSATPNMEPALAEGALVLSSSWKEPTYNDIIVFRNQRDDFQDGRPYVDISRVVGLPGDTIEMIDGHVYRNGHFADSLITVHFAYMPLREFLAPELAQYRATAEGQSWYEMPPEVAKRYVEREDLHVMQWPKGEHDPRIILATPTNGWNRDNMGPILVADSGLFVLCDNRHIAYDSRYDGPVHVNSVISTALN